MLGVHRTYLGYNTYNPGDNNCRTLLHFYMSCSGVIPYEITHYNGTLLLLGQYIYQLVSVLVYQIINLFILAG